ncbi:hypothetical protein [Amycolatopsis sp. CA-230715]|uniref:hypothetical protein n=1 Tax=Amycolatopsis sp. CA-230715 TaxID=2745196 RepID=UPI001C01383F|nr:hypothetical protein [Amycolatopsis sp. CA-230715]QWF76982.1 hypothetical protein HUW46_00362 [Amycolatopsis sp. CA-230715]
MGVVVLAGGTVGFVGGTVGVTVGLVGDVGVFVGGTGSPVLLAQYVNQICPPAFGVVASNMARTRNEVAVRESWTVFSMNPLNCPGVSGETSTAVGTTPSLCETVQVPAASMTQDARPKSSTGFP